MLIERRNTWRGRRFFKYFFKHSEINSKIRASSLSVKLSLCTVEPSSFCCLCAATPDCDVGIFMTKSSSSLLLSFNIDSNCTCL